MNEGDKTTSKPEERSFINPTLLKAWDNMDSHWYEDNDGYEDLDEVPSLFDTEPPKQEHTKHKIPRQKRPSEGIPKQKIPIEKYPTDEIPKQQIPKKKNDGEE